MIHFIVILFILLRKYL